MKNHTQTELNHLAPDTRLFEHMKKLNIPETIYLEVWEQKNFISASKKEEMCQWGYYQFLDWYCDAG